MVERRITHEGMDGHDGQEKAPIPALVVCPGRGTYSKNELGYLKSHGRAGTAEMVAQIDQYLASQGNALVADLDGAERFSLKTHTSGENASPLIYACSKNDFHGIDRQRYTIAGITGNSMGWYTALALGGALSQHGAIELIYTMGSMMRDGVIGGQLIYPVVDKGWRVSSERQDSLDTALAEIGGISGAEIHLSIRFGGYAIFGGNQVALKELTDRLPRVEDRYPFVLVNHAAFHTPMMDGISQRAFAKISQDLFQPPTVSLVDGRGKIWHPETTDPADLYRYTLGDQVCRPYDFTQAVTVALKELQPEAVILLGPGATTGGALGQILVGEQWQGIVDKASFARRQEESPLVLAMGRDDQRQRVEAEAQVSTG